MLSQLSVHLYSEILDNFLILLIENWFGDEEVIFLRWQCI